MRKGYIRMIPGNDSGDRGNGDHDKIVKYLLQTKNIIIDLYQYYFYNGFQNILIEKLTHLLISYFMMFIINFIINCVDYKRLIDPGSGNGASNGSGSGNSISDYIDMSKWFSLHPYMIIYTVLYGLYLISITIKFIGIINKFWKIRQIYNRYLKINDHRLKFITWDEIVNIILKRLSNYQNLTKSIINGQDTWTNDISIYTINNKICSQSNLIISLIRGNYINLRGIRNISKFIEWNYIFCIVEPLINILNLYSGMGNSGMGNSRMPQFKNNKIIETNLDNTENMSSKFDNYHGIGIGIEMNNQEIYKQYTTPLLNNNNNNNTPEMEMEMNLYMDDPRDEIPEPDLEMGYNLKSIPEYPESINNPYCNTNSNSNSNPNIFDTILFNTFINPDNGNGGNGGNSINGGNNSIDGSIGGSQIANIYLKSVIYRMNLAIIINIIALPFIMIMFLIYLTIKYGERIYNNPGIMFQRKINIKTLWKLRYYNELPNLFKERTARIEHNMDKIINSYTSPTHQIIIRFLIFTSGSLFIFLLIMSFISTEAFIHLNIINGHNVIWLLGLLGTFLIILNKIKGYDNGIGYGIGNGIGNGNLSKMDKIAAFDELKNDLVGIDPQIAHIDDREYLVNLINKIYHPRITYIFYELVYLILTPYYIWKWKSEIILNHCKILDLIEHHHILGHVCKYSIFTNAEDLSTNPHMLLSMREFNRNHDWNLPAIFN